MRDLFGENSIPHESRGALLSDDRRYRYALWRFWAGRPQPPELPPIVDFPLVFIGLNPSTADEQADDATITRMSIRARDWGYGGLVVLNLFAYRATKPDDMKAQADPVGPGNDATLRIWSTVGHVICGWGNHGTHRGRAADVRRMLKVPLHYLKLNNGGEPQHPLYLPYEVKPTLWEVIS